MKPSQGTEKAHSLKNLTTKQQLHDDPTTAYTLPCPLGSKRVKSTCVKNSVLASVDLDPEASKALTQLRDKLLKAGAGK